MRDLLKQLVVWITGLALAFGLALGAVIDAFGVQDHARPSDAIVVLGARVEADGRASEVLRQRALHAAQLYDEGIASRIVLSGGVGDHPPSEARAARAVLLEEGVPRSACVLEEESHSTAQNARNTAEILRRNGWQSAVVVSDPYHLLRARQLFRREGFEVATSPALETPRHTSLGSRIWWTAREVLALLRTPSLLVAGAPTRR